MKKTTFGILVILIILLSLAGCQNSLSNKTVNRNGIEYKYNPDLDGYDVVGIANDVAKAKIVSRINKDKVLNINEFAFKDQKILTSIDLPQTLINVEGNAFEGCTNLKYDTSCKGLNYLGNWVISTNEELETYNLKQNTIGIASRAFYNNKKIVSLKLPSEVKYIGTEAFALSSLVSINIPEGVEVIKYNTFSVCQSLLTICIPDSVKRIEEDAFYACSNLTYDVSYAGMNYIDNWLISTNDKTKTSYELKPNTIGIYEKTFEDCSKMNSILLPDSVEFIGAYAFHNCYGLETIGLSKNLKTIRYWAFASCSNLKSIILPNELKEIGTYAFYNCMNLETINLPNTIENFGDSLFAKCPNIKYDTSHEGLNYLDNVLVSVNDQTKEIYELKDNTTAILYGAFESCTKMISIEIPKSVISIDHAAFKGCSSLKSLSIPKEVRNIGSSILQDCPLIESLTVDKYNKYFDSRNDSNSIIETYSNTLIAGCKSTIIPNSVEIIGYGAFAGSTGLKSIIIPESVTSIYNDAFRGTSLESIIIPDFVTEILGGAFTDCLELKMVKLPNSLDKIPSGLFSGCSKLETIAIPESVKKIGAASFEGCMSLSYDVSFSGLNYLGKWLISASDNTVSFCEVKDSTVGIADSSLYYCQNVTSIILPRSIKYIGNLALPYYLSTVYYKGNQNEWNSIDFTFSNNIKVYYFSETEPKEEGRYWHYVDQKVEVWE